MIVTNPTDKNLEVTYKGSTYSVEANGTKSGVPEDAAMFWKNSIHQFITVRDEVAPVSSTKESVEVDENIIVDQELLDENPVLAEAGIKVGDIGLVTDAPGRPEVKSPKK